MKKIVFLLWGIAGVVVLSMVCIWVFKSGVGFVRENFPQWIEGGKKIVNQGVNKINEILPEVKEAAKGVVPGFAAKVQEIIPGTEISTKDVDGEDIKPISRYPGFIRISYVMDNQKKTIRYQGKVNYEEATAFYKKKMAARGYNEKVLNSSLEEVVYHYTNGPQVLEFRFKKISTISLEITELTIKEL